MKLKKFNELNDSPTYTQEEVYAIAADIRNKLGPIKSLVSMLRRQKEETDPVIREKLQKYIDVTIDQCDISIDYLKNFITND